MRTIAANMGKAVYDPAVDVMYFELGSSRFTDEDEIASGIHVLYACEGKRLEKVVAVEVERFGERFGAAGRVEVPLADPFALEFPAFT